MPNLEKVVRPFQSQDVFIHAIPASSAPDGDSVVTLELGKDGADIKSLQGSYSSQTSKYCDQKSKEFERDTHVKRITNPDDESQYVDVEVIDKITDKKGSGLQYQKTKFVLNNDQG